MGKRRVRAVALDGGRGGAASAPGRDHFQFHFVRLRRPRRSARLSQLQSKPEVTVDELPGWYGYGRAATHVLWRTECHDATEDLALLGHDYKTRAGGQGPRRDAKFEGLAAVRSARC